MGAGGGKWGNRVYCGLSCQSHQLSENRANTSSKAFSLFEPCFHKRLVTPASPLHQQVLCFPNHSLTSRRRRTRLPHWKQSRSSRIRLRSTLPFTLATSPSLRKEWWWTLYHSTPPIIPSSVSRPLLVFKGLISQKI